MLDALLRAWAAYHHRAVHLPRVARVSEAFAALLAEQGAGDVRSVLDVGAGDSRIGNALGRALGAERIHRASTVHGGPPGRFAAHEHGLALAEASARRSIQRQALTSSARRGAAPAVLDLGGVDP